MKSPVELVAELKTDLDAVAAKGATALFILHREPFEAVPLDALDNVRNAFARINIATELLGTALALFPEEVSNGQTST